MMQYIQARLILEWKDLHVTYPLWLTRVVMDELYYITALVATCVTCFAVGMIMGFIVVLV